MPQATALQFREDRWEGNKWPSIDITPNDVKYFMPILAHLVLRYEVKPPRIIDLLDGYAANFEILGTHHAPFRCIDFFYRVCQSADSRSSIG